MKPAKDCVDEITAWVKAHEEDYMVVYYLETGTNNGLQDIHNPGGAWIIEKIYRDTDGFFGYDCVSEDEALDGKDTCAVIDIERDGCEFLECGTLILHNARGSIYNNVQTVSALCPVTVVFDEERARALDSLGVPHVDIMRLCTRDSTVIVPSNDGEAELEALQLIARIYTCASGEHKVDLTPLFSK